MQAKIELEFREQVDSWVKQALFSGSVRFDGLIGSLPGVDPVEGLQALRRLAAADQGIAALANRLIVDAGTSLRGSDLLRMDDLLPRPHPLDCSWLFDDETIETLLKRALSHSRTEGSIILLGAPTVFSTMARRQ